MDLTSMMAPPNPNIAAAKALAALSAPNLLAPGGGPAMTSPPPNMAMPAAPAAIAAPHVNTPAESDLARLNMLKTSGSGVDQIQNPLVRGIARAGDIALSVASPFLLPGLAQKIPGTTAHHQLLVGQQEQLVANDQAQAKEEAVLKDSQAQAKLRSKEADKYGAQADDMTPITLTPDQAAAINHPELTGTTTTMRDYARTLTSAGRDNTLSDNNTRTNDTRQNISSDKLEAAARAAASKPEQRDDHYITIMAKPPGERTADDLSYKQGYEGYIKAKMTDPRVAGALARPVVGVTADGGAHFMSAGDAVRNGATAISDNTYKAQGAALKDFTSGTDSHTLTAFNTAKGHLQQLAVAGDALQNGDIQALNKLANTYGTATGQSAPVVFQGVKTAVSGEIAKAFTGAGATVDEIGEIRKSINDANSPEQLHDVVNSYLHLLDTKSGVLRDQFSAAKRGQANFGGQPAAGKISVTAPDGSVHPFDTQAQADKFKKLAGIK